MRVYADVAFQVCYQDGGTPLVERLQLRLADVPVLFDENKPDVLAVEADARICGRGKVFLLREQGDVILYQLATGFLVSLTLLPSLETLVALELDDDTVTSYIEPATSLVHLLQTEIGDYQAVTRSAGERLRQLRLIPFSTRAMREFLHKPTYSLGHAVSSDQPA
jgi:hypothetical protein